MTKDTKLEDDWIFWWYTRKAAMEKVLGKSDDTVRHSLVPFYLGYENGGAADVIFFQSHLDGIVCITSELIGCEEQVWNRLGNYELMICHRRGDEKGAEWGSNIISRLAYYTCDAELNPGETMDIGPATPDGSTITAFLFFEYATFLVNERKAGLLLCMGITEVELNACLDGRMEEVENNLKAAGVYPFTDLFRESVV